MSFFKKLFGGTYAPPVPGFFGLPSLTIAIFGAVESVSGLQSINGVYLELVGKAFPATEAELAKKRAEIEKYYQEKVNDKLQILAIPRKSEAGTTERVDRLFSIYPIGMIWLLLEAGAIISPDDAVLVPSVLSEFISDGRCMLVQGKGYHAFLNSEIRRYAPLGGKLSETVRQVGFVAKRVRYINIDPRKNDSYEL